jgi:hypothetical protein
VGWDVAGNESDEVGIVPIRANEGGFFACLKLTLVKATIFLESSGDSRTVSRRPSQAL